MARYSDYITKVCHVSTRMGDEWLVNCLFHKDNNASMCVNVRTGLFICYSCGAKGNITKIEQASKQAATQRVSTSDVRSRISKMSAPEVEEVKRHYPDSWLDQYVCDRAYEYWGSRGLAIETIESWNLGYDKRTNSATIPVRDFHGKLLGIFRRRLNKNANPRYLYPKGFNISWHLWGAHTCHDLSEHDGLMVVTEGSVDALAMSDAGFASVALLGSRLSDHQRELLCKLSPTTIVVCTDNDEAGEKAAQQVYDKLKGEAFIYRGVYPRSKRVSKKDPAECSEEERIAMVTNRVSMHKRLRKPQEV